MPQNTPHNQPEQEKTPFEEQQEKQTKELKHPQPETTRLQPEVVKPEIPETQKPEMPKEEGIPKGGPGDQQAQAQAQAQTQAQPQASAQTQTQAQAQTPSQRKKERVHKVKGQLNIKIPAGTPAERKVSGQIEDWHSNNILNQP
jgi:hypothetical protein